MCRSTRPSLEICYATRGLASAARTIFARLLHKTPRLHLAVGGRAASLPRPCHAAARPCTCPQIGAISVAWLPLRTGRSKVWPGPPHRALRIAPPSPKLKPAGLSGRRAGAAERKDGPINSVAFSPDGTNIVSGLYDQGRYNDQSLGYRFVQPAQNASRRGHGFQRRGRGRECAMARQFALRTGVVHSMRRARSCVWL